jgi:hypothetical protein
MVMGFAVSASATEFSDADTIAEQNQTAVEVLTALNIINGYPDGTYRPTGSVTRAQVAKMIAVAFNGGDESLNELYQNVTCGLTDIGGTWAEGYIKYCYATGIVNGYPDGTFKPENPVTGNELCQIMLNILGYEIDTTNTPWATAVLAKSNLVGLLENVSTPVGSACPRQEAAQIIYNALDKDIMSYSLTGVLTSTGENILTKYLGVVKYTGVVVANEYADLTTTDGALDEGTTEIQLLNSKDELTDETIVFDFASDLDDIGESVIVYGYAENLKGATTALLVADTGMNSTYNTGAAVQAAPGSTLAATIKKASGLTFNADTADYYVNYDAAPYATVTKYYSDGVLVLDVASYDKALKEGTNAAKNNKVTYTVDDEIDYDAVLWAYNTDNLSVGTSTTALSSTVGMSWTNVKKLYIEPKTTVVADGNFTGSTNGDYVKLIDFNGDNKIDYVLEVDFVLDQVATVGKQGATIATQVDNKFVTLNADNTSAVEVALNDELVIADGQELSTNDVILYTEIAGIYYTVIDTPVIDTVSAINYKAETFTGAETEYSMSGIVNKTDMNEAVKDLSKRETYKLYEDHFGYVRAFIENGNDAYILLTEMYTNGTSHNQLISDRTYTAETVDADGTVANYTVVSGANLFYDRTAYTGLVPAVDDSWTNIAGASIADDEISLASPLQAYHYASNKTVTDAVFDLTANTQKNGITKAQRLYTGEDEDGYAYQVNVTSDTLVYLVYGEENAVQNIGEISKVEVGTGYSFINKVDAAAVNAVYAVATSTNKTSDETNKQTYQVAKILVIEINADNFEDAVALGIQDYKTDVESLLSSDGTATTTLSAGVYDGTWFYKYVTNGMSGKLGVNTICEKITSNYNKNGIYTALVNKTTRLNNASVTSLEYFTRKSNGDFNTAKALYIDNLADQNIYQLVTKGGNTVLETYDYRLLAENDLLILVYNGNDLSYILRVNNLTNDLYDKIAADETDTTYNVTVDGVIVDTVASGSTYTVPAVKDVAPNASGTGFKYGSEYVAPKDEIEVTGNIALESSYVAWTVNGTTTIPVAYQKSGVDIKTTLSTSVTGDYVVVEKGTFKGIKVLDSTKSDGTNTLYPDADATFIDGLYEVTIDLSANNATSATIKSGTVYNAQGEKVTDLADTDVVYAAEGTVIVTLKGGDVDNTYTITAKTTVK